MVSKYKYLGPSQLTGFITICMSVKMKTQIYFFSFKTSSHRLLIWTEKSGLFIGTGPFVHTWIFLVSISSLLDSYKCHSKETLNLIIKIGIKSWVNFNIFNYLLGTKDILLIHRSEVYDIIVFVMGFNPQNQR